MNYNEIKLSDVTKALRKAGFTKVDGAASESLTNWPQLFFPRLFGYLNGEISEAEIIAEICA